ncbi:MAG: translation elongation factor Ts [Gemmatimonadaceae bacterium]|nr:translation elongation factor Ts [Gemmatimonadaceae bacterium]
MTTMTITTKLIAELREKSGAGIGDCKKALEETGGDVAKAMEYLRAKGIAKAGTRTGRAAAEGLVIAQITADGKTGALIELACETDFVARNDDFVALAKKVADFVLNDTALNGVQKVGAEGGYLDTKWGSETVGTVVKGEGAKTGENVLLKTVARFTTTGALGSYVHHNGKVGALVQVDGGSDEKAVELAKYIAEHLAAGVPAVALAVSRDRIPADKVESERRIAAEQAAESGKPANIVEKMVEGRVNKYYAEVTLTEQPWVRDDKQTIAQLVKSTGAGLSVARFARVQLGVE